MVFHRGSFCLALSVIALSGLAQSRPRAAPLQVAPGWAAIESAFPAMRKITNDQLFTGLGGGFLKLKGNAAFANTCGVRLSQALLRNQIRIPARGYNTLTDAAGAHYIFRALELKAFLTRSVFGAPAVHHGDSAALSGQRGIIVFAVNFTDNAGRVISTGHIDLWDGAACVSQNCSSYFNYHDKAVPVYFWSLH